MLGLVALTISCTLTDLAHQRQSTPLQLGYYEGSITVSHQLRVIRHYIDGESHIFQTSDHVAALDGPTLCSDTFNPTPRDEVHIRINGALPVPSPSAESMLLTISSTFDGQIAFTLSEVHRANSGSTPSCAIANPRVSTTVPAAAATFTLETNDPRVGVQCTLTDSER